MQFRIKICGIRSIDDALAAVDAGADAIGLNFFGRSPRYVSRAEASLIAQAIPEDVDRVGVFVNSPFQAIREICESVRLNFIQLHGDEPPELLQQVSGSRPVIRARRLGSAGVRAIQDDLRHCCNAGASPAALLVDSGSSTQYGGTGNTLDWLQLVDHQLWLDRIPLILAGGLNPDNVAAAIQTVRPYAVDVASGVEAEPGKKDPAKMRRFVNAARVAFTSVAS